MLICAHVNKQLDEFTLDKDQASLRVSCSWSCQVAQTATPLQGVSASAGLMEMAMQIPKRIRRALGCLVPVA